MCRRSTTGQCFNKDKVCHFSFLICIKNDVYYVVNGLGSTKHSYHPHINPEEAIFPPRLMEQIDKPVGSDLLKVNANLVLITNMMFKKSGTMYKRKIWCI